MKLRSGRVTSFKDDKEKIDYICSEMRHLIDHVQGRLISKERIVAITILFVFILDYKQFICSQPEFVDVKKTMSKKAKFLKGELEFAVGHGMLSTASPIYLRCEDVLSRFKLEDEL